MKAQRLTFDMMSQQFTALPQFLLRGILAGDGEERYSDMYSDMFGMPMYVRVINGSEQIRFGNYSEWFGVVYELNEVNITGPASGGNTPLEDFGFTENPFNPGEWTYSGPGGGGESDPNSIPLTQRDWYVAISNMFSSMDLSVSASSLSAQLLGLQMPAGFVYTGHFLTATSLLDNSIQLYEGFNWNDASQLGVGLVLVGVGVTATAVVGVPVVFVGGVGLFIWELAE